MYTSYLRVRSTSSHSCMCLCGRFCVLLNSVTGNVFNNTIVISLGVSWLKIAGIQKCYDCMFVCLPAYLFFKLFNNCEHVIVGIVLSEHSEKCDIAIFCHSHTHSVISVSETDETESGIIVKYELCMISTSSELYRNHTSSCDLDLYVKKIKNKNFNFYFSRNNLSSDSHFVV